MRKIILTILLLITGIPHIIFIFNREYNLVKIILFISVYSLILYLILSTFKDKKTDRNLKDVDETSKINFLTNISHEIRTPLNGIMGMNNLLLNSELNEDQKGYAKTIRSCSDALLSTINDIQDFSKITNGTLEIENLQFDLRKLVSDFYVMNHLTADMKDLSFSYSIDSEATNYYSGDPGRIRQILSNLYNNAIKFTNEGKIELRCSVVYEEEFYSTLKFCIKDSGIGIKQEDLKLLFNEFTQGDSSSTRNYGGIGLGLTISKQLVGMMGGKIGAESSLGIGSEFWFSIKLKKEATLQMPKNRVDFKDANCLIVNKGTIVTNEILKKLENEGINVTECRSYKASLELILKNNYNILFFDLNIHENENINLSDYVSYIKSKSNINLISLTPEGNRGDGELCRKLNIDGYFVEPFDIKILTEAISIILGKSKDNDDLTTLHTIKENKRSKVKILLVDDNNINLIIAEKLLIKMGFHTGKATNGEEAIEALKLEKYHLIFMDIQMPIMNGLQATELIRSEKAGYSNKDIPIIALTANYTNEEKENCSMVGMNEFLTKPYNPLLMEKVINRFLIWEEL